MPPQNKKLSRLFLFAALTGVLFFSWGHSVLIAHADVYVSSTQGLWHFLAGSSANDSSTNGYTLNGSSTPNTTSSFVSTGLHDAFDDTTHQYVLTSSTPNFSTFGNFSVFGWMQTSVTSTRIFSDASQDSIVLYLSAGKLQCQVYVAGFGAYVVVGNTTVTDNLKHFVGCIWDGSLGKLHVYVDGAEDATAASVGTGTLRNGASALYIGEGANDTEKFTGKIDEVLLTNTVLPTSTISQLYNSSSGAEACITVGCGAAAPVPSISTGTLKQFQSDGVTPIATGTGVTPNGIAVFQGQLLSAAATDTLQLQIEVQPSSTTTFTGVPTATSTTNVTSNSTTTATVSISTNGSYHWQARVLDTNTSVPSAWQAFGGPVDYVIAIATSTNPVEIADQSIKHLYHFNLPASSSDAVGTENITSSGTSTDSTSIVANLHAAAGTSTWAQETTDSYTPYLDFLDFSFAVWVQIPSTLGGRIISFADQDNFVLANNNSHFLWQQGDTANHYPSFSSVLTTATGTTYFVAGTWDHNTGQMVMYINNATDTVFAGNATGDMRHGASRLYFGTGANNTENYHGRLDEVVFSGKKWTAAQMTAMYNGGAGAEVCITTGCGGVYYAQIQNASGSLKLRSAPTTAASIIKILPQDWIVYVSSTLDSTGLPIVSSSNRWFDVVDKTDNVEGWMAASSSDGTIYLSYVSSSQSDFQTKASSTLTTSSTRAEKIVDAVNWYWSHVSSTNSLYNTTFASLISPTSTASSTWIFPKELFYAMASQESGNGNNFDNQIVSFDYGHGIMQLTFNAYSSSTPNQSSTYDNRGVGSLVTLSLCPAIATTTYTKCYTDGGATSTTPKPYKHYDDISTNPKYMEYANTPQSIYANIKDGLTILDNNYKAATSTAVASSTTFQPYEREWLRAAWKYNGGSTYLTNLANRMDTFSDYYSSTGTQMVVTSSFSVDLASKLRIADNNKNQIIIYSPVTASLTDSVGRQAGIVNGVVKEDIPDSAYSPRTESAVVFFPDDKEPFTYTVTGKGTGTYGLQIIHARNGIKNIVYGPAIPTKPGQVDRYSVDWNTIAQGGKGVTVKIDHQGNGIIDKIIATGADLADISLYTGAPPKDEGRPVIVSSPSPVSPIQPVGPSVYEVLPPNVILKSDPTSSPPTVTTSSIPRF